MEIVEVLVRIPKKDFEELQSNYVWWGKHGEYIKNGTVLPKGHGELIDKEQLFNMPLGGEYTLKDATKYGNLCAEQQHFSYSTLMMYELADIIEDAPTVIEADGNGDADG